MKKNEILRQAMGNISYLNYENCREAYYNKWCHKYAVHFALPLRKLVSNDYLQNWYQDQWLQKVELAFYQDHRDYLEGGVDDPEHFMELFMEYPDRLLEYYPKAILNMIKKEVKSTEPAKKPLSI